MRPQKVEQSELLKGLMSVFRHRGYEGASLSELAKASGLQKASLYHRFPGGKKEIARSVLNFVGDSIDHDIYNVLTDQDIPVEERIAKALTNIETLYDGGNETCILRAMTMDAGFESFGEQLHDNMKKWLEAFRLFGLEMGMRESEAKFKAEQTLILIQGSLVLSKAISSTEPFKTSLMKIRVFYTP